MDRNPNSYMPYSRSDLANNRRNSPGPMDTGNRRLIRPSLTEFKDQQMQRRPQKRPVPPDQTNAENFFYVKQMQARTPMVIVLNDGEELHGVIEWYDRSCIKINRLAGANLLVYKNNIKYLYKESDNDRQPSAALESQPQ